MLEHALYFARLGIPVFPACFPVNGECGCGRGHSGRDIGKAPLTPHGFKDATTDEAEIRRQWQLFPYANVAIATGGEFGLVVVDVDGVDGEQSIAGRHMPATPTVRTPGNGGGTHWYFRAPKCTYKSSVRILPGLDIRANGGYVIAPPSLHRNGEEYRWINHPDSFPFSPPPHWLVELMQIERERPEARLVADSELLKSIAVATRALQDLSVSRRDEYGPWLEVGMALSELGDIGLQLWEAWSRESPKYEPGVCAQKWGTFTPGAGLGIGSLVHWAREDREERQVSKPVIDIERAVLGYAIVHDDALPFLVRELSPDMFAGPLHRPIWNAIKRLYMAGSAANLEAIEAMLGEDIPEEARLSDLPTEACPAAVLPGYIEILREQRAIREIRELGYEFARIADSRNDVVQKATAAWNKFVKGLPSTGNEMTMDEIVSAAKAYTVRDQGFTSGIPRLDRETGRLEPGNLVFLYGTPGQGKTLLALAMARRQGQLGIRVGFVSLEMAPGPLGLRVVTAETGRSRHDVTIMARNPNYDNEHVWEKVREKASGVPVRFAFNVRDIDELVRLGRRWNDIYKTQILYIDHLQEITTRRGGESSVQAMDYIVGCLKDLALATNMVVITLAQFNRSYLFQLAEGKELGFESLRGSSRIEQSADKILFLLPEKKKIEYGGMPSVEDVVIKVKKNRNGKRGEVKIKIDFNRQDIIVPAEEEEKEPWAAWGEAEEVL